MNQKAFPLRGKRERGLFFIKNLPLKNFFAKKFVSFKKLL